MVARGFGPAIPPPVPNPPGVTGGLSIPSFLVDYGIILSFRAILGLLAVSPCPGAAWARGALHPSPALALARQPVVSGCCDWLQGLTCPAGLTFIRVRQGPAGGPGAGMRGIVLACASHACPRMSLERHGHAAHSCEPLFIGDRPLGGSHQCQRWRLNAPGGARAGRGRCPWACARGPTRCTSRS
jgi:hypothetical protein